MQIRLVGKKSVYLQIADEYKHFILMGILQEGEKLPSCRVLGMQLGINPNTVERAYNVLETEGFIKTLPQKGAYVSFAGNSKQQQLTLAQTKIQELMASGITKAELNEIINTVYDDKGARE